MIATVLSLKLLHASVSCVLAGLLLRGVLQCAQRRWPALAAQRTLWLLAQGVIAGVFLLALLPHSAQWSVVPPLTVPAAASASPAPALLPALAALPAADPGLASDCLLWLPTAWLAVYLSGLLWGGARLWRMRRFWRVMLAASRRLSGPELAAHPAFHSDQLIEMAQSGLTVRQTSAAVSPMLAGLLAPCLLLPEHMHSFSVQQQQMIIEHELTHWRRCDPLCRALALLLETVLWFNPAMRWLSVKLNWAQELSCDRQVLAGRPAQQQQHYAAALVMQLKVQAGAGHPAASVAFGAGGSASMLERIRLMRQAGAAGLSAIGTCTLTSAMLAVLAGSALLQPVFAQEENSFGAPNPASASVSAPASVALWRYPLEKIRVNSFYGVISRLRPAGHKGIDFGAPTGTPILATAAGTVLSVDSDDRYGNFIVVAHAQQQRSLYAHLDSVAVKVGEAVGAGQVIGKVGETGLATGPHLHLEAFQGEQRIDPQLLLSGLDDKASKAALRARAALHQH